MNRRSVRRRDNAQDVGAYFRIRSAETDRARTDRLPTDQRKLFTKFQIPPYKAAIHRLGKLETVFVVAALPAGIVYYEDVEEGFELGRPGADGAISHQGCNQYRLTHVLANIGL